MCAGQMWRSRPWRRFVSLRLPIRHDALRASLQYSFELSCSASDSLCNFFLVFSMMFFSWLVVMVGDWSFVRRGAWIKDEFYITRYFIRFCLSCPRSFQKRGTSGTRVLGHPRPGAPASNFRLRQSSNHRSSHEAAMNRHSARAADPSTHHPQTQKYVWGPVRSDYSLFLVERVCLISTLAGRAGRLAVCV